ncbi:RNA polymerase sigma factor [Martelella soudanensis]|uniref:RNA polymerase sigma factor n=1 Tax=unclassified Martelella TaxID=2629616 RepID=UPI0015DEEA05|nr:MULTISPECIES: sigma-70 family RNA polymerase sigma factor [unclassified Martelella]
MDEDDSRKAIEAAFRIERARLVAGLVRYVGDLSLAEEFAQEALVAALSAWPKAGIPANPAAWLMTTAKRRAIDHARRRQTEALKESAVTLAFYEIGTSHADAAEAAMDDDIGDERLALIFTACHPVLTPASRVALTLKVVAGLSTAEIARAFVTGEATVSQRVLRAKNQLGAARPVYEVPTGPERVQRLASVLEVVYLIFNEGYAATSGNAVLRPPLSEEAMRLGRILAALLPEEPEVLGLLALMELQAARFPARIDRDGVPVPITEQNRARWDRLLLTHGFSALERAFAAAGGQPGPYTLQAAIAARHGLAPRAEDTDWRTIAAIYDRLIDLVPSPVVALNRAIAHSMAGGPELGLTLLAEIEHLPALAVPLYAARADCLLRAGHYPEAADLFARAMTLSGNHSEKAFFKRRIEICRRN